MFPLLVTFALSLALCALARPLLRRLGIIDQPNARSSHSVPTVRGLGVGIVAAVVLGWMLSGLGSSPVILTLALSGLALSVVSFADDVRPVSPLVRLGCHALAAFAALTALTALAGRQDRPAVALLAAAPPVGFLFVVGYTNAFNFMDGINGLAGFQGLLTGAGAAAVLVASGVPSSSPVVIAFLVIAGACAGFLPHNFPNARGFMGDVASTTLGFWLSACVLWAAVLYGWELLIPLSLLHANFILDTGVTLVRRALRRERLSQAHRDHFYQRLVRSGLSHTATTGVQAGGLALSVLLMCVYVRVGVPGRIACALAVLGLWAAFFSFAERRFSEATRSPVADLQSRAATGPGSQPRPGGVLGSLLGTWHSRGGSQSVRR